MDYRCTTGAALAILVSLSACGGGGGGGSTPPVQTSNPIPQVPGVGQIATGTIRSSAGGSGGGQSKTDTVFSITSNPSGLSVFENGTQLGATPIASYDPVVSAAAQQLSFSGGLSPAYTIAVTQTRDGARSLYYNAAADSSGSLSLTTIQSVKRSTRTAAVRSGTPVRRSHLSSRAPLSDVVANEFVVRYRPAGLSSSGRRPADVERGLGAVGKDLPTVGDPLRAIMVPSGQLPEDFGRKLAALPEVAFVHPVHVRHLLARSQAAVNDPLFSSTDQWYLATTGAPYAWSYSTGSNVTIAVIDTGFDNHNQDLVGKVVRQGKAVTAANATTPAALQVGAGVAQDSNGHGTSVTGLAAAATNNGYGFASIGHDAKLFVYDVFTDTTQATFKAQTITANGVDEATAISDAVANGADVINLSLGSSDFDDAEQNAVEFAISKGVTVVAAAGNNADGRQNAPAPANIGTLDYPGAYDGVISVGASALNDFNPSPDTSSGVYAGSTEFVPSYSQYSTGLGVVAPGGGISDNGDIDYLHWIPSYSTTTAVVADLKCSNSGGVCVQLIEGTSQATPQVSGAAVLLISLAGGHGKLTPAQVAQVLYNTADNISDPHQGHGRLNVYRALAGYLHDTSAASGPTTTTTGTANFIAFAYANSGANRPKVLDINFPSGVPVDTGGNFRIADVPASTGSFKVGVWYDANGNGYIDPGDQVGISAVTCSATAPCTIGQITVQPVTAAYALP